MKSKPLLLCVLLFLTGCVSARLSQLPKPDGQYAPAIYAAASVGSSTDRAATLRGIASKSDLTEVEQIYLLEVLEISRGFSGDMKEVLLALLTNRATTAGAKKRLSEMLPRLGLFSGDAQAIAEALAG